jgi:hypothetical protein
MSDFLNQTSVQLTLSMIFLAVITALGYRWVSSLRDLSRKSDRVLPEALGKFEEMRREGDISEAEFRNIEAVLGRIRVKKSSELEGNVSEPEGSS